LLKAVKQDLIFLPSEIAGVGVASLPSSVTASILLTVRRLTTLAAPQTKNELLTLPEAKQSHAKSVCCLLPWFCCVGCLLISYRSLWENLGGIPIPLQYEKM